MLASLVSMSFMIFGFYSWQRYFLICWDGTSCGWTA